MESQRKLISSGSAFEAQFAYSRAVVDGDWIFVSGCSGYDYATGDIASDVVEQAEQAMKNVASALSEAGAQVRDIVRVRYILPDRQDVGKIAPVLRRWLGDVRPAATMMHAGLVQEAMKIEVEITAHKTTG